MSQSPYLPAPRSGLFSSKKRPMVLGLEKGEKLLRRQSARDSNERDGRFGSAQEFLELSKEEQALVEIKLAMADAVKEQREKHRLSQGALAARMISRQSRVAKIEAGHPTVSLDLLVLAVVAPRRDQEGIGKITHGPMTTFS